MTFLTNELVNSPIIPALKQMSDVEIVCGDPELEIVVTLFGDLIGIGNVVARLNDCGKKVFVNTDLVSGFSAKEIIADFVKQQTLAYGIMSSKPNILRYAKSIGLVTIHRFFIIDSFSYYSIEKQLEISRADIINILPGWPKIISWAAEEFAKPIIASGLVCDRRSVNDCLSAGACAISTTNHDVWAM